VEGASVRQTRLIFSLLGLILAASAARAVELPADYPKKVTLFGNEYNVTVDSRAGSFKNGVAITLQTSTEEEESQRKANLAFAPGADPSSDRLFVVAPVGGGVDGPTGDQFYMLKGADPQTGAFNERVSEATQFFGGNVNRSKGGQPNTVAFISDVRTEAKKDKNVALTTFAGEAHLRFYDLDTLGGTHETDAVLSLKAPRAAQKAGEEPVAGMPNGGWISLALGPDNTLIAIGRTEGDSGIEVGVMDLSQDQFANARTDLGMATGGKIEPANQIPHALARVGETEYWLLTSELEPGGSNNRSGQQNLYHLRITPPADLAAAEPGSIKAEVLGKEDLSSKKLGLSDGGIFGMAVGRELAPGKRVVYFADWLGNLITLAPVLPAPGAAE
jgi:hypothetical protein